LFPEKNPEWPEAPIKMKRGKEWQKGTLAHSQMNFEIESRPLSAPNSLIAVSFLVILPEVRGLEPAEWPEAARRKRAFPGKLLANGFCHG
jgi:hypothetical protein